MPVKVFESAKDLLKYVLTVGLSGSIIYLVTLLTAKPADDATELELKKMNSEVKAISVKVDGALPSRAQLNLYQSSIQRTELKVDNTLKLVKRLKK